MEPQDIPVGIPVHEPADPPAGGILPPQPDSFVKSFISPKRKMTKALSVALVVFLITVLPLVVYLVKTQRPSLEKEAFTIKEVAQAKVWVYHQFDDRMKEVEITSVSDSLDENGKYTVSFRFSKGERNIGDEEIELFIGVEKDKCSEGNGQGRNQTVRFNMPSEWPAGGYCFTPWDPDEYDLIKLNQDNNFTQIKSYTTVQEGNLPCGSFQTDVWILSLNGSETYSMKKYVAGKYVEWENNNCPLKRLVGYQFAYGGKTYANACMIEAWGNYKTGKNLDDCGQQPTPTPIPPEKDCLCDKVTADRRLDNLQPGDVINFTGFGKTSYSEAIDEIKFTISKDGEVVDGREVAASLDREEENWRYYQAKFSFVVPDYGDYEVKVGVHCPEGWKD